MVISSLGGRVPFVAHLRTELVRNSCVPRWDYASTRLDFNLCAAVLVGSYATYGQEFRLTAL